MKELKDMSHLELLKEFNRIICIYDSRKDDELNFLEENPNRVMWDSEMESEYESICDDIKSIYKELRKISDFVNTL